MSNLSGRIRDLKKSSYIKLTIYQSYICQNMKVPLPYYLSIDFGDFSEKESQEIIQAKETLKSPSNEFIYYLNNDYLKSNFLSQNFFIISGFTKSIFILKNNFASVKIPLIYAKNSNERQWFFLKDMNDKICIKLLLSIKINFINNSSRNNNILNFSNNINNNILKRNNETIKENNTKNTYNISSNSSNNFINNIMNKHHLNHNSNTFGSTNFISASGNSLLNNSNNINNNFNSSILSSYKAKNSSNSFSKKNTNNNNQLVSIVENDCDSITINDNDIDIYSELSNLDIDEKNKDKSVDFTKINNFTDNEQINIISKLIESKKNYLKSKEKTYMNNHNKYKISKTTFNTKNQKIIQDTQKLKNDIKKLEKNKQIYETKIINLNENFNLLSYNVYRQNIQADLDLYEKDINIAINNINLYNNNEEILLENKMQKNNHGIYIINNSLTNEEEENIKINNEDISAFYRFNKNKGYSFESNNKNSISILNKLNNDYQNTRGSNYNILNCNKIPRNREKDILITSLNKLNSCNTYSSKSKLSPINYKYKDYSPRFSLSISNSPSPAKNLNTNNSELFTSLKDPPGNYSKTHNNNSIFNNYYDIVEDNNKTEFKKKNSLNIRIPYNNNNNYCNINPLLKIINNKEICTTTTNTNSNISNNLNTISEKNISNTAIKKNKEKQYSKKTKTVKKYSYTTTNQKCKNNNNYKKYLKKNNLDIEAKRYNTIANDNNNEISVEIEKNKINFKKLKNNCTSFIKGKPLIVCKINKKNDKKNITIFDEADFAGSLRRSNIDFLNEDNTCLYKNKTNYNKYMTLNESKKPNLNKNNNNMKQNIIKSTNVIFPSTKNFQKKNKGKIKSDLLRPIKFKDNTKKEKRIKEGNKDKEMSNRVETEYYNL